MGESLKKKKFKGKDTIKSSALYLWLLLSGLKDPPVLIASVVFTYHFISFTWVFSYTGKMFLFSLIIKSIIPKVFTKKKITAGRKNGNLIFLMGN